MIGPANPNRPLCTRCGNDDSEGALTETPGGDELCPGCHESYQLVQAERAYEAECDAYYGGDMPAPVYARNGGSAA